MRKTLVQIGLDRNYSAAAGIVAPFASVQGVVVGVLIAVVAQSILVGSV